MATNFVVINDNTLRQRLRQFNFRPDGPITDTTRDVYVRKLQQLERTRGGQLSALANTTPAQTSISSMIPFQLEQSIAQASPHPVNNATPQPSTFFARPIIPAIRQVRPPASQVNHHQGELVARSAPSEDADRSNNIVHGKCNMHITY